MPPAQPRPVPLKTADLPAEAWRTGVPIRFSHCDPAGIVYTPVYFDLFNGVIEDFYPAALGLDYHGLIRDRRLGVGYAQAGADFLAPSRMGDTLDVAVVVERIGRSSFTLVLHAMREGAEAVRGRLVSVTTVLDTGAVVPIPDDLRAALAAYRKRCG